MGHGNLFINMNKEKCKLKPIFASRDKVISTFDCAVTNGTTYIEHIFPNVIYLITWI